MENKLRLIDANALVDRITDLADANRRWKPEYSAFCDDMVCMIEDTPFWNVDDLHQKGRWNSNWYKITCSLCNHSVFLGTKDPALHKCEKENFKFCPNCGADMREG